MTMIYAIRPCNVSLHTEHISCSGRDIILHTEHISSSGCGAILHAEYHVLADIYYSLTGGCRVMGVREKIHKKDPRTDCSNLLKNFLVRNKIHVHFHSKFQVDSVVNGLARCEHTLFITLSQMLDTL